MKSICSFAKPLPKALHIYTIDVTDEQMDAIHAYLKKILRADKHSGNQRAKAVYYNPTFDRFEEM